MAKDSKAEALEKKGLYRRAATRWTEVMQSCGDDYVREEIKRRRDVCLEKARCPPAKADDFSDVREAARETQKRMGIDRPDGEAFRYPISGKKRRT